MKNIKSIIESILFMKGEPIKIGQLVKIIGEKKAIIIEEIETLFAEYKKRNGGITIIKKGDTFTMVSSPENAEYVKQLTKDELEGDLSKVALETLAIVAYRGPISRVGIEAIRGVNSSFTLRNLRLRGLIERNNSEKGRGYLYEVSVDFLKKLGISSIEDLPDFDKLQVGASELSMLSPSEVD